MQKLVESGKIKSEDDLINIINSCSNYQDSVCLALSYHGFKADDILELKIDHIKGNDIYLEYDVKKDAEDENGQKIIDELTGKVKQITVGHVSRHFKLKDRYIQLIKDAYYQTVYLKNNGVDIEGLRSPEVALDTDSRYIIHGTLNQNRTNDKPSKQIINNRIKRVVESFGSMKTKALRNAKSEDDVKLIKEKYDKLYTKLLTLVNVFYSGMFIQLHEIEEERPLIPQDYMDMREQYGLDGRNWNDLENRYHLWKKNL
jgi:hypothetical protein